MHEDSTRRVPMQTRDTREVMSRRGFLKLGFASILSAVLLVAAGCAEEEEDDDDDDGSRRRRRRRR
jgi:hypothetical protein